MCPITDSQNNNQSRVITSCTQVVHLTTRSWKDYILEVQPLKDVMCQTTGNDTQLKLQPTTWYHSAKGYPSFMLKLFTACGCHGSLGRATSEPSYFMDQKQSVVAVFVSREIRATIYLPQWSFCQHQLQQWKNYQQLCMFY